MDWHGHVYRKKAKDTMAQNWLKIRQTILHRDNYVCLCCDRKFLIKELTVHHVIPRSEGGADDPSNLVTLCKPCHDLVEVSGSRSIVDILALTPAEVPAEPGVVVNTVRNESFERPEWHKWVYGGQRHKF